MIAGGVGFIMSLLEMFEWLLLFKTGHFLVIIGGAIFLKLGYGILYKESSDPINSHPLARKMFYAAMAILVGALFMRKLDLPYYEILLYLDIPTQIGTLAISFSAAAMSKKESNEDVLDS